MTTPIFRKPPPGITPMGKVQEQVKPPDSLSDVAERLRKLEEQERTIQMAEGLPFLYGWKWYSWAREFYESRNPINLLCAANQISKSSTQIRKCIHWATAQDLWPELWARKPIQFWYLYPTKAQVNAEFETKWKQFLPKGEYKDDPYYGWTVEKSGGFVTAIHFNSGVHVYFKTYAQDASSLQTGTCDALFCDEELPVEIFDELMFRISASSGYFHMVFTATLGQDFWRRAMEPEEGDTEELPTAYKRTVSLYDAMTYEDGTPSHWTIEKIKMVEARCSTNNELLKRVHGRFIIIGGRKYESFDIKKHIKDGHPLNKDWLIYAGVDIGSGDKDGHPSAIVFVAVRPDFRAGRVFLGWRGDGIATTAGDVVQKYREMKIENKLQISQAYYDWGNKDFFEIATRAGESFEKAEKGHDKGEDVVNTLFKNNMLYIYEGLELRKLANELATLKKDQLKRNAKDDFADALRYAVTLIPWDWSALVGTAIVPDVEPDKPMNDMQRQIFERRKAFDEAQNAERERVEDEFNEWNDAYGE